MFHSLFNEKLPKVHEVAQWVQRAGSHEQGWKYSRIMHLRCSTEAQNTNFFSDYVSVYYDVRLE